MTSIVTAELGTKENPHSYKWQRTDEIIGHYYLNKKGNPVKWDKRKDYQREYQRIYKKQNKVKLQKYRRKYRKNNPEIRKKWRKENRDEIKERKKIYMKEYQKKNKDKIKKYKKEYVKERLKTDHVFKLIMYSRNRVLGALKAQNAAKNQRTMEYINCSIAHLYNHIECQFGDSGMDWDNMGREDGEGGRGWEVDHRRPCESFDLNDEEQKYMCFHWTNLQPMWGQENSEKSDNYDPKTFRYKWIDRETGWVGIPKYLMNK